MTEDFDVSAQIIRERTPGLAPSVAMVLGSGLGAVAEAVKNAVTIPYSDLPGFPVPTVQSHAGSLVLGRLSGVDVAIMQGRTHYYENGLADAMKPPLRTLSDLGCKTAILTNSAGSLRTEAGPGSLMMITDHINYAGMNPLIGEGGNERFVDMTQGYDRKLIQSFRDAAGSLGVTLHEGTYIWFSGPNFETPAEVRAARVLGADAVGMSTVPEVLIARWLGMRVAAVSIIANPAAGMGETALSHEMSMAKSAEGAADLVRLLDAVLEDISHG
ncbi:MAG: purine-nucleoside phosphorylase [Rhodospirillales bacterium]|nr:purine-nucleoside phosphorylase [Alphaproteobacteria bacterium]MBL6928121.1 purine-nucleoside phosphorylase [Rhodospirillales bacterium]